MNSETTSANPMPESDASHLDGSSTDSSNSDAAQEAPARKRPKPGERRLQILQTLASMLEQPGAERITTAALSAKLGVSEAALYRHFASKAQMFEGLIDFVEQSVFALVRQIADRGPAGPEQVARTVTLILQFAEKNPGMARVMTGDALVFENERLQERMNLLFDKLESAFKQSLREAGSQSDTPTVEANVAASTVVAFIMGRLQRFARSGFKRLPSENLQASLLRIL